jgi:hypothetical protein
VFSTGGFFCLFFVFNIFHQLLVESIDTEPVDVEEDQLYFRIQVRIIFSSSFLWESGICNVVSGREQIY